MTQYTAFYLFLAMFRLWVYNWLRIRNSEAMGMKIKTILAGILAINGLHLFSAFAGIVTLNSDQGDYRFSGTNTYYLTNVVTIWGTATFEAGTVVKYRSGVLAL